MDRESSFPPILAATANNARKGRGDVLGQLEKTLIIIQITKLEQFITPPIEIDKRSKKEWVVLEQAD